ncbi:hypothetical protein A3K64_02880 [Candidatus Micrarchaeota archaeon RBG_16_36_9]|nr:MAG: hypothetical protein A3K64_02880 [Candidatus Micrarchaeota archaeon RBG_16_36_9]
MNKYLNISFLDSKEKNINYAFDINLMRFFWILIVITIASVAFFITTLRGLELIIPLFIIDFIALLASNEFNIKDLERTSLISKIESLEKSIYDLFNKKNTSNDKKEIIECLNNF